MSLLPTAGSRLLLLPLMRYSDVSSLFEMLALPLARDALAESAVAAMSPRSCGGLGQSSCDRERRSPVLKVPNALPPTVVPLKAPAAAGGSGCTGEGMGLCTGESRGNGVATNAADHWVVEAGCRRPAASEMGARDGTNPAGWRGAGCKIVCRDWGALGDGCCIGLGAECVCVSFPPAVAAVAAAAADAKRGELPLLASLGVAITSLCSRRSCCMAHLGVAITGVFPADEGAVSGDGILRGNVRLGEGTFGDAMGVPDTPMMAVPKLALAGNICPGDNRGCRGEWVLIG